jgi:disulfide bond formation protein DsbB
MKTLPFAETFKKVLRGTGECAAVDWTFLGLSIAEWSFLCFALFVIGALLVIFRAREMAYRL